MIYVLNYADGEPYESFRKINTRTAYRFGKADKVIECSSKDIPQRYKDEHKEIFAYKRGAGLWLWKPYIIQEVLSSINDNDWLFYCDSGAIFINSIRHIVDCAQQNSTDIFLVEQPLLNRQFCKHEAYVKIGQKEEGENQLLSGYILIRNNAQTRSFIREWKELCEDIVLLSPDHLDNLVTEWPDYYSHREDQAILTLLRIRHNLPSYRDPSDYGEMPFMYCGTGKWTYNPREYPNSTYPTIILSNRKANPYKYWVSYFFKHVLHKLGIFYTEERFLKKKGLSRYISK